MHVTAEIFIANAFLLLTNEKARNFQRLRDVEALLTSFVNSQLKADIFLKYLRDTTYARLSTAKQNFLNCKRNACCGEI